MITLWQIESCNRANTKLRQVLDDPRVARAIADRCAAESVPYRADDPRRSFADLFTLLAARDDVPAGPTESPDVRAGQRDSHEQGVCETIAAEILDGLGITY